MGRLTVDISDAEHQKLRIRAIEVGVTVKDFVLAQLRPALSESPDDRADFRRDMDSFAEARKQFKLKRGKESWKDIIHAGHK